MKKECLHCTIEFRGRSDKKFCSTRCKNNYNYTARKSVKKITITIDKILHRNYEILRTIMGEQRKKMMIERLELEKMGFSFNYITGIYTNSKGKVYHYVYDFAWMQFSTQQIMIVKK